MKIKYTQNIFLMESNSERTNREKKLKRQNKKKNKYSAFRMNIRI